MLIKPPTKIQFPNWKVYPLLMWVPFVFTLIGMLGVAFSKYEMTMRFKVHLMWEKKDDLQIRKW